MRIVVTGGMKTPVLYDTSEATALYIETDEGSPAVLYKFFPNGKGYLRLTKGEDPSFQDTCRQLGLKK